MHPKNKNFSSNNTENTENKKTPRFIYRVLVKVGYHDNGYDFEYINDAVDFMKTVIRIYTPNHRVTGEKKFTTKITMKDQPGKAFVLICFIILHSS